MPRRRLDAVVLCDAGGEWRIGGLREGRVEALTLAAAGQDAARVGRLVLGRAGRRATGIDAVFVEIGEERPALLRAADGHPKGRLPDEGSSLVVQVTRAPVPGKGSRVTLRPALSGRRVIYRPRGGGETAADLQPLLEAGEGAAHRPRTGGPAAKDQQLEDLAADDLAADDLAVELAGLRRLWHAVLGRARATRPPATLWAGPGPVARFLLDHGDPPPDRLVADGAEALAALREACAGVAPELDARIRLAPEGAVLPERAVLDAALEEALDRRVSLPGGAALTIDATEALTVIDVDGGAAVNGEAAEAAALSVNLAAVAAIARQLRLRDIGGAVVVDLIGQGRRDARARVLGAFRAALAEDPQPVHFFGQTGLGLVELTRQSGAGPLAQRLLAACATCRGGGRVLLPEYHARAALQHLAAAAAERPAGRYRLRCAPEVAGILQGSLAPALAGLQARLGGAELALVARADYDPARTEVDAG